MPIDARQLGKHGRLGTILIVLTVVSILIALLMPHKASAAGLLPELASVDLPLANTVLEPVVTPVTNTTNAVLPVDIHPDSDAVGATIAPTPASEPAQPLAKVSVPVQPVVRAVTRPSELSVASQQPLAESAPSPSPTVSLASSTRPSTGSSSKAKLSAVEAPESLPFFSTFSTGFGMIPQSLRSFASSFATRPDFTASMLSIAVLITVLAMIGNIIYVSERGGLIWNGSSRLARLSQKYDLTQLSIMAVSSVGAISVALLTLLIR